MKAHVILSLVLGLLLIGNLYADVTVTQVTAKQRYPWNGLVDITVTLAGDAEDIAAAMIPFYATNKMTRTELPVNTVTSIGSPTRIDDAWTRRFIWDATADVGRVRIAEVELTVGEPSYGVQLWEGGPYWAECNVGATKPEEYGYYFWWGDTVGYKRNAAGAGWVSVKDGSSFLFDNYTCPFYGKSISELHLLGFIDSTGNLAATHDAAIAHLGTQWRMPTSAEFEALKSSCSSTWMTRNGVYGRLFTGRGAYSTKSIFLPAAGVGKDSGLYATSQGYYWSSTEDAKFSNVDALFLCFDSSSFVRPTGHRVWFGSSVRPVRGFAQ